MKKLALSAVAATFVALPALAGTAAAHDRVDQRQYNQAKRIEHGRKTGQLTWWEARKLKAEQARIAAAERHFKRDGHLSRAERARLEAMQDRASQHIRHERTDGQTSWRHRWHSWR
jgi:uncharacterized membrane protein YebE (DUF533 family)